MGVRKHGAGRGRETGRGREKGRGEGSGTGLLPGGRAAGPHPKGVLSGDLGEVPGEDLNRLFSSVPAVSFRVVVSADWPTPGQRVVQCSWS